MPIVADAAAAVRADMSGFNADLKRGGEKATQTLGQQLKSVFSPRNLAIAGVAGGLALAGAITAGLSDAVKALIDIERLNAQTDAVIRSTGGAANVTRQQIEEAAEAAEAATTIEREAVQEAQNMLLTFTNIRNQAGAGNDIFTQATDSVLDMSVAMGTDAKTASIQLGKALNDPIKGVAALGRVGIQFTDDQKELIASLVETGDLLGAQKIVLAELETQFGGSAEAFANTTAGRIQRFQNDVGTMFESIIVGATKVADFLGDDPLEGFAMNFGEQGDRVHDIADRFGQNFDDLKTRIEARMDETGESFTEATDHIESEMEGARLATQESSWEMMQGILSSVHEGGEQIKREFERQAADGVSIMSAEADNFRDAAFQNQVSYAKGILDGQNQPKVQWEAMVQLQDEILTNAEREAYLKGLLASQELADGLQDNRPAVRAQAEATRLAIVGELANLGIEAYQWGYNSATGLAAGMDAGYGVVINSAGRLGGAIRGQIGINSEPEDPSSPLRGITKWGGNVVKTIADDMLAHVGLGTDAARSLAASLVPGLTTPSPAMAGGIGASPGARIFQLYVNGVERTVSTAEEAIEELVDMGAFSEGRLGG